MEITLSNLALRHLVKESQFLVNGFVNKSQSLDNGWIKLKIHTKEFGDKNLILAQNAFFVSNYSLGAKMNPGGFSALLKKYLMNQRIVSLTQHSADRIVVFEFPSVYLIAELFSKGNLILCNKEMMIIKAMRREEWKDRKLEQNEVYKFPSSKGLDPSAAKEDEFSGKIKSSNKTFFGASVDALNTSPLILEYIFDKLPLDKKKDAKSANPAELKLLLNEIRETYDSKAVKPFIIDGAIYTTSLGKKVEREFDDLNSALNTVLLEEDAKTEPLGEAKANKKQQKHEKELAAKKIQIEGLGVQEREAQEKGERIYLHYNELKEVIEAVKKGKAKGLSEKEIVEKINKLKPIIKELDFKKKKLIAQV